MGQIMRQDVVSMNEGPVVIAVTLMIALAVYFLVEFAYESSPPVQEGQRDLINATAAFIAAALLIAIAIYLTHTQL